MNSRINYKFDDLLACIDSVREDPEPHVLKEFSRELNLLFKDSICKGVLYTINSDKMFFGVYVMPEIEPSDIYRIILDEEYTRIKNYYVELDSKLFDKKSNLTSKEILSILLYEISEMINSSSPIELAIKEIDVYLDKTQTYIKETDNINYALILTFGFKDLIHKITSIFCNNNNKIIFENDFIDFCGFESELTSAMMKLRNCEYISILNQGVEKATIIAWVLNLYNNIKTLRIITNRGLRKVISYTPIRLIKNDLKRLINSMNRLDDSSLIEESFLTDLFKSANKSIFKTINDYEGDYYDLKIQSSNVLDEDDALMILHTINTKISILDSFIDSCDLDKNALNRTMKLRDKFYKLRDDLSNRELYRNKYRRIYVNYED